ncbi:hypothetical protein ACJVDH_19875 [Pedobacter sp. AW1-32]|uniref:hypothetical protein n=1 Tax=Pedobacter sp. AW1-32 TaxID=3383026 RepID=UPI003FF093F5
MKRQKPLTLIVLAFIISGMVSCKKGLETDNQSTLLKPENRLAGTPAYAFDWENSDFMPTPAGSAAIPVPWGSGASRQFTVEIANDYKSVNGWTLVYNTFNTSVPQDRLYFILYNKYRGLLRMYYYLPNTTNLIASANIVHKLGIEGMYASSSPIMNFAGAQVVDFNSNSGFASTLEQWQVAPATWYAFEYELAYDPNLYAQSFGTLNFIWPITSNQITQVAINGTITGTLTGNISTPGLDLTVSPTISINNGSQLTIKGDSDVEKAKPSIASQLYSSLKNLVAGKLTSALGGVVENIFSGIFGGKNDASSDNVSLKIDASVSLTGTMTSNVLLSAGALSVPGYNQAFTPGFTPLYNDVLGVFYLSNKPIMEEVVHIIPQKDSFGNYITPKRQYVYSPRISSLNLIFNPSVLNIATIQNIRYQAVLHYSDMYEMVGGHETVGESQYVIGSTVGTTGQGGGVVGVRVTFDVVPNDGSPKSVITKTFAVNVETSEVTDPEGEDQW